ncbi:putative conserved membrane protein [Synechococcus sp. BIOS-U3-1]|uniref:hypothetical protein n=1 Tax=Synechococcus sp. BIOS-U3-1 TaxID=1400865 RepID=UPI001648BA4B|nr:hypothetical protein [Synechococcus sp. BIOS-U3-1]QNI58774.1 putative conserved membrane protein [Synechococcus sp. BIOS-U3-1]|tara:strand:- start:3367 stop:4146 length:780 start_codon:yes stop_codon:yes gene_type:complete
MQDQDARDERSLPAPYQSPWDALRQDLPAAAADLRLRVQELWRRNREGDLSTPGFWPQDLAPLFWPVLLVVLILLLALGVIQLRAAMNPAGADPVPAVERILTTPLPEARPLMSEPEILPAAVDPEQTSQQTSPQQESIQVTTPEPETFELPKSELPVLQVDPLLKLLEQVDADRAAPAGLLMSARPVPAENAAVLVVDSGLWSEVPQALRRERAESWWATLQEQGYDAITLEDVNQHLLARPARVGGGMIMFDLLPSP